MWASARAAQLASLSTNTGTPKRRPSSSRSGTPASGMFTLVSTVPVAKSICEGTPTPIASGCPDLVDDSPHDGSMPSSSASVCPSGGVLGRLAGGHAIDRRHGDLRAANVDAEDHSGDSYPREAVRASAVTWDSPGSDLREAVQQPAPAALGADQIGELSSPRSPFRANLGKNGDS